MSKILHRLRREEYPMETVREPCLVEMGTEETGEHGLGAGASKRCPRVRPLKRFEAAQAANQGGTTVNFIVLAIALARTILSY